MTSWLIDKSALVRLSQCAESERWANRIKRGLVRIASITLLEIGYSARNAAAHSEALKSPPIAAMPVVYLTPMIEQRALSVQGTLSAPGKHRTPSLPDLLIAATAEAERLTVLHLDKDFELIASITGQPTDRLPVE